jgi:hypothetical protein
LIDFVGGVFFLLGYFRESFAHESLHRGNGVGRVGDRLTLCRVTYFSLSVSIVQEGHNGWRGSSSFAVLDDYRLVTLHYGYAGVGGTQVNAYNFSHDYISFMWLLI